MKMYTYLNYGGNCKQAFEFYEEHLGGKITMMLTHSQQPDAEKVTAELKNSILHARIDIGKTTLLGSDVPIDRFQPMRSAYLSLLVASVTEALRIYRLLSDGVEIFIAMQETFF